MNGTEATSNDGARILFFIIIFANEYNEQSTQFQIPILSQSCQTAPYYRWGPLLWVSSVNIVPSLKKAFTLSMAEPSGDTFQEKYLAHPPISAVHVIQPLSSSHNP